MITKLIVKYALVIPVVVGTHLLMPCAVAGTVDFEPVVGTISGTNVIVFEFDVTASNSSDPFRAVLTDLQSPAPFTNLGLVILDETGQFLIAGLSEPGSLNFQVDAGNYLAVVGGIAGGDLNIGTFGLEISEVPVPPSILLMFSALIPLLLGAARRKVRLE